jgi:hypothetical protein
MKIRNIIGVLLLGCSLTAMAEFKTISRAYEIALSNFRVPATPNSGVIIKQCDDCEAVAIRVTPKTEYTINGESVTLKQFRKIIFRIRDREDETIVVLHHLASDTVLSVSVTI